MLAQRSAGSIVATTAGLGRNTVRGMTASVPMVTKGGLETITQHLAMEYAKDGIRVNAVAPGAVYTPLHRETPKDVMIANSTTAEDRLGKLGTHLPGAPTPFGAYVPAVQTGNLLFL